MSDLSEVEKTDQTAFDIAAALADGDIDQARTLLKTAGTPSRKVGILAAAARKASGGKAADAVQTAWTIADEIMAGTRAGRLPGKSVAEFADAIARTAAAPSTIEVALRKAVLANPGDRIALARWEKVANASAPGDRFERLLALQDQAPELLRSVVVAMLDVRPVEQVQERCAGRIAALLALPEIKALERLWRTHGAGEPIDPEDAASVQRASKDNITLFFLLKSPTRTIVPIERTSEEHSHLLRQIGVDTRYKTWLKDFLQKDESWQAYMDQASFPSEDGKETASDIEDFCGFQERIVRDQNFRFKDLISGQDCCPVDSWQMFGRTCYMFLGAELFYVISAGSGSKALCVYFPRYELVLDLRAGLAKLLDNIPLSNTLSGMAARLARLYVDYNRAISHPADSGARKKIVISLQKTQNFAHHYWNFYTGLERLALAGLMDKVARVQFASTEFFGPIDDLFPELAGKVEILDNPAYFDPCPFSRDELLVSVGGYAIPKTLLDRTRRAMAALPLAKGAASPNDRPAAGPVVWIGMRLGDKSWVTQDRGIPALVDKLAGRFPGLLVLLDGFSFPVGRDLITHKWAGAFHQLRQLAEDIRNRSSVPDQVISMIGNSLRESVLWAARTDVYLTPIGTTQHKIGWFTTAPGVVYSADHGKDATRRERMPGAWEAEGGALPLYVTGRAVAPGERRGINDQRNHLDNIDLNVDALFETLSEMIAGSSTRNHNTM